jgi:hypothetical protein
MKHTEVVAAVKQAKKIYVWGNIAQNEGAYFEISKEQALFILEDADPRDHSNVRAHDGSVWMG